MLPDYFSTELAETCRYDFIKVIIRISPVFF